MALYARLFAEMGGDGVDFGRLGADEADARLLPAIHSASSGAEVAVLEVGIRRRPLLCGFDRRQKVVLGNVVIEQERGCEVEMSRQRYRPPRRRRGPPQQRSE